MNIQSEEDIQKKLNLQQIKQHFVDRHQLEIARRMIELIRDKNQKKQFTNYNNLTVQEENQLLQLVKIHGENNWSEITNYFDIYRPSNWYRSKYIQMKPDIKKYKWCLQEDIILNMGVKIYQKNWSKISKMFNGQRTDVQCRERYCNILDPNLQKQTWNEQNDQQLLNGVKLYGQRWSLIQQKVFKGKTTDNQCKRRWKTLNSRRYIKQQELKQKKLDKINQKNFKLFQLENSPEKRKYSKRGSKNDKSSVFKIGFIQRDSENTYQFNQ